MTTPIMPTKTVLKSTTYTPAQLIADQLFETYLLQYEEGILFVRALMEAYRAGDTALAFTCSSSQVANSLHDFLKIGPVDYGYTVTVIGEVITLDWS